MPPARRSAPTTSAACSARRTCSTPVPGIAAGEIDDAELRGIEDEAIADVVRMQADVGLRTATDGEFRRASWHMDFIYAHRRHHEGDRPEHRRPLQERRRHPRLHAGGAARRRSAVDRRPIFGRGLRLPAVGRGRGADGEADDPVAVDGPLPRGRGRDRSGGLPRRGLVLGRSVGRLLPAGAGHRRAGLHLPAARRHQPGLPQRPAAAGRARRPGPRRRAPARALHPADQRGAGRPAGRA